MTPRLRKIALYAHITFSIGWIGSIVPYIALAIAGITARDNQMIRASIFSMDLIGWYVIVPFSFAALLSGIVQSLITQWGLIRHWWILAKLLLTVFATFILWQHMEGVSRLAHIAKDRASFEMNFHPELIHSFGGLVLLLVVMIISLLKPWGMTAYGRSRIAQKISQPRADNDVMPIEEPALSISRHRASRIIWIHAAHAVVIGLVVTIIHLAGMHHH